MKITDLDISKHIRGAGAPKDLPGLIQAARGASDSTTQESFWERLGAFFDARREKTAVVEPRQTVEPR